ncbi:MAG: oxygen-independent coproporphyrinogen III oxidase [Phenylobacterium sp.]|nr:oxygen-independent coproporphyrinogen III oxidase [Phenylobacterium sp.]
MTIDPITTARARRQADLVARYDGRAPRYTSYPTALQFSPDVDEAQYRRWLAELPTDRPVSLYVHVPFCARLCWYCGCNTRAVNRHEPVAEYLALLLREAGLLRGALPRRMAVSHVHLGGGSPNMFSAEDLDQLFGGLAAAFEIPPAVELAAELDPANLTRDWVEAAAFHGLNRASLGVQNLDPAVQQAINRQETFDQVADAMGWLRAAGVGSVNVDLMYGLPHQTVANTLSTLEAILDLSPERIALFGYAHVPWMKAHQRLIDEAALPGPTARLDQAEQAAARLTQAGYVRVGLDHFARADDPMARALETGGLHRNFQGYTTDGAEVLLGLGASAIGRLPHGFVQNAAQEVAWRASVAANRLPVARGVELTADDRFRADIIERLMCELAVDLGAVCGRHGRALDDLAESFDRLAPFMADGLIRLDGARLQVVGDGRLVIRSICAVFDTYFAPAAGRHSRAI